MASVALDRSQYCIVPNQRQRIAIARAVLPCPPVLLFDEATSALDSENEQCIQKALEEVCRERAVLIIAHRLSTIQRADVVLVMEEGEIKETGTYQELVAKNGIFASLLKSSEIEVTSSGEGGGRGEGSNGGGGGGGSGRGGRGGVGGVHKAAASGDAGAGPDQLGGDKEREERTQVGGHTEAGGHGKQTPAMRDTERERDEAQRDARSAPGEETGRRGVSIGHITIEAEDDSAEEDDFDEFAEGLEGEGRNDMQPLVL